MSCSYFGGGIKLGEHCPICGAGFKFPWRHGGWAPPAECKNANSLLGAISPMAGHTAAKRKGDVVIDWREIGELLFLTVTSVAFAFGLVLVAGWWFLS
jgi:hypothetical protein